MGNELEKLQKKLIKKNEPLEFFLWGGEAWTTQL